MSESGLSENTGDFHRRAAIHKIQMPFRSLLLLLLEKTLADTVSDAKDHLLFCSCKKKGLLYF